MTRIFKLNPKSPDLHIIEEAARVIENGGLVVFPTETVYGIAASLLHAGALERLKRLKERPETKQFSIHIASKNDVAKYAVALVPRAYKMMERFWPGPLTLVLNAPEAKSVGLRMPRCDAALRLLERVDAPVIAPSANLADMPAPRTAQEALESLHGRVDLVLDAGPTELGCESTVLDARVLPFKILREGYLKKEEVLSVAGQKTVLFVCTGNSCRSVMAEYILRKKMMEQFRHDIEVLSAGTFALFGMGPTHETLRLIEALGLDASAHRAQRVSAELVRCADLVLTMERRHKDDVLRLAPEARDRVYVLGEFVKFDPVLADISDPIGQSEEFYRQCFNKIKQAIDILGGKL